MKMPMANIGIFELGKAYEIANEEMSKAALLVESLKDDLKTELLKINGTLVNVDIKNRIFNTTNICFKGQDSNVLIVRIKDIGNHVFRS